MYLPVAELHEKEIGNIALELTFLVPLTGFVRLQIHPTYIPVTDIAAEVSHSVHACHKMPIFFGALMGVYSGKKEKSFSITPGESLGYNLIL